MKNLSKLTILIIPKEINICNPNIYNIKDLGANYYISEDDIIEGKRRDEISLKKLSQLNKYVSLSIMERNDIFKNLK